MNTDPHYVSIAAWLALSGMTRSGTYRALAAGDLRAIKQPQGRRTLIDARHGLDWLRSQPWAKFRAPQSKHPPIIARRQRDTHGERQP